MTKKKKSNAGRKTVFTPEVVQKLEEFFRLDCSVSEACHQAMISERVYYDECKRNPTFLQKMQRAQEFPFILMKKTVIKAVNQGDGNLALKVLKNRQNDRYQEKSQVEQKTTIADLIKAQETSTPKE